MDSKRSLGPLLPKENHAHRPIIHKLVTVANTGLKFHLAIDKLEAIYRSIPESSDTPGFLAGALDRFKIDVRMEDSDLKSIPAEGPAVVVSNRTVKGFPSCLSNISSWGQNCSASTWIRISAMSWTV